jgi:hypothetical protein
MAGVKRWLTTEKRAEEPYLFHDVKPRRVIAGSRLLFSFEAKLFGIATAKTNVEDIPPQIQEDRRRRGEYVYKHSIVFEGCSIDLLPSEVAKKHIKRSLKINCDRPFRYLKRDQYNRILGMGGLTP